MEFQVFRGQVLDGQEVQRGTVPGPLSAARTDETAGRSHGFRLQRFTAQGGTADRKVYSLVAEVIITHLALIATICIIGFKRAVLLNTCFLRIISSNKR